MSNDKAFLRHEILNIITLINFLVIDTRIEKKKKEEILEHLKMVSLFVSEENIFLGKAKNFFNQSIDLNETLEIIRSIIEKEMREKGLKIVLPTKRLIVYGDGAAVKNGLEQLFRCLLRIAKKIELSIDEISRSLIFNYESNHNFSVNSQSLIDFLKEKHVAHEIFCKIAVEIMKMNRIKINFGKGVIKVQFPKK